MFNVGDEYWVFTTNGAEIYDEIYWPFITLEKRKVQYTYERSAEDQQFYFNTKQEAIDKMVVHIKSLKE